MLYDLNIEAMTQASTLVIGMYIDIYLCVHIIWDKYEYVYFMSKQFEYRSNVNKCIYIFNSLYLFLSKQVIMISEIYVKST
jgi:hypothetical protein